MPVSSWRAWLLFTGLMLGVGYFDRRLAMYTIGAVGIVTVIRNPDILGG